MRAMFHFMTTKQKRSLTKIKLRNYLWLLIPLALSPLRYTHAYIDPGTGSYLIQITIGVLFAGTYAAKRFIAQAFNQIKVRITKPAKKEEVLDETINTD